MLIKCWVKCVCLAPCTPRFCECNCANLNFCCCRCTTFLLFQNRLKVKLKTIFLIRYNYCWKVWNKDLTPDASLHLWCKCKHQMGWGKCARKNDRDFKYVSVSMRVVCAVSPMANNTHIQESRSLVAVLRSFLCCCVLCAVAIVRIFRWFTCLNAAAAKAIRLAAKCANSHIQSFHTGVTAPMVTMMVMPSVLMCMCLWFAVYELFSTWFLNKFSFLWQSCNSSKHVCVCVYLPAPHGS